MRKILIVEDESAIARLIRDYLERAGFLALIASDGDTAVTLSRAEKPDLVVLDLGLPKRDGFDVTRQIRQSSDVPIIIVTARGEETDRIVGLELGADDYIVKPFSPKELVARVRAVLRRVDGRQSDAEVVRAGDLELDAARMRATIAGTPVDLTATEFQILTTLAREPGRIFTRNQLLDAVHGVAFESYERAIDAHIKNLRRKLEPVPASPKYIQTVYGVGYRFAETAN
jgi:DNA-binding response OmpR family regulator